MGVLSSIVDISFQKRTNFKTKNISSKVSKDYVKIKLKPGLCVYFKPSLKKQFDSYFQIRPRFNIVLHTQGTSLLAHKHNIKLAQDYDYNKMNHDL